MTIKTIKQILNTLNIPYTENFIDKNCIKDNKTLQFNFSIITKKAYIIINPTNEHIKYCKDNDIHLVIINDHDLYEIKESKIRSILELSDIYELYTQKMYKEDILKIREYIENKENKKVMFYSLYRGSLKMAYDMSLVTNSYNNFGIIKFQSYDGNDNEAEFMFKPTVPYDTPIYVLDDIYDSGLSIKKTKELFNKTNYNNVNYVTLYSKNETDEVKYFRKNKLYVKFIPWEGY